MKQIEAYKKVCKILGVKPLKIEYLPDELPDATLVIIPDKVFKLDKLIKLAEKFGEDQPYKTYVYAELYRQYSDEELSGKLFGSGYRVIQIPDKLNVEYGTVEEQKKTKGHVPSVLEAICFWYTLRELGKPLNFDSTYIRHFDLESKRVDDWLSVPGSCVRDDGRPGLFVSYARYGRRARVSVGSDLELAAPLEAPSPLNFLTDNDGNRYQVIDTGFQGHVMLVREPGEL